MTGGDQMRLVSLLGGTKLAERIRRMVRDTNVVLAGTSAGAAAMSTSMIVRGEPSSHPHKNAFGYRRASGSSRISSSISISPNADGSAV